MPYGSVTLKPGVDTEKTVALNEAGVSACNLIRYRDGLIEKLGGWTRFYPYSVNSPIMALRPWGDQYGVNRLAVGAQSSLSVIQSGAIQVITPKTATHNVASIQITTTSGSALVSIADTASGTSIFDTAFFATPVYANGITLFGAYPVQSVADANNYTIKAGSAATATSTATGTVPSFTTTNGSYVVTVAMTAHGFSAGSSFVVLVPTVVGGLTLSGAFPVQTVLNANSFTIFAHALATSGATVSMDGGNARIVYYHVDGPTSAGAGYGINGYGSGGYGLGTTPGGSTAGTPIVTLDWTLDNWGGILVACAPGGPLYQWDPSASTGTAGPIANAPFVNDGMFVSMPARILVAWGSTNTGVQDPLLVKWSNVEDFTTWTPSSTNQAGSYRLTNGSKIVGGMQGPTQGLIWTDLDLWAMQYIGYPLVYGFNKISTGCGMIARGAATMLGNTIYWMGSDGFYSYSAASGVQSLNCPVWDVAFQNMRANSTATIKAASNSLFNEVAWYFQSASSSPGANDSYVKFNAQEGEWDYGSLDRSAWTDASVLGPPIGASPTGLIYQHETSNDADGAAMNSSFTTGYFTLDAAETQVFVDRLMPDFKFGERGMSQGATLNTTVYARTYPHGTQVTYGPYQSTVGTQSIDTRIRGSLVQMMIGSADLGSFWRIGNYRYRFAPDGRR